MGRVASEASGVGVIQIEIYPHPDRHRYAQAIDPPHKGEGKQTADAYFPFSSSFAASHSASISAKVASFGVLPRAASARSIEAKRRSNF